MIAKLRTFLLLLGIAIFSSINMTPSNAVINGNSSCVAMAVNVFKSYGANLGSVFRIIINTDTSWSINPGWTNVAHKKIGDVTVCDGS